MCFPKRFYPLRRRHQIKPPLLNAVQQGFEVRRWSGRPWELTGEKAAWLGPDEREALRGYVDAEEALGLTKFDPAIVGQPVMLMGLIVRESAEPGVRVGTTFGGEP